MLITTLSIFWYLFKGTLSEQRIRGSMMLKSILLHFLSMHPQLFFLNVFLVFVCFDVKGF